MSLDHSFVEDGHLVVPRSPREWAAHILKRETLEERRALAEKVPEEWKALVKKHAEITWELRRWKENHG